MPTPQARFKRRVNLYLKQLWYVWLCLAVAVSIATIGILSFASAARDRRYAEGASVLNNCLQIENIKNQIRDTVEASIVRIDEIQYYKDHPVERARAIEDVEASVRRFAPNDCYILPVVKSAGFKRGDKR